MKTIIDSNEKKKLIFFTLAFLCLFFSLITLFSMFMHKKSENEFQTKGISIPATILHKNKYYKSGGKGSSETICTIQLSFSLNQKKGTVWVSEYIGESEWVNYEVGQKQELIYLDGTEYFTGDEVYFTKPVILRSTLDGLSYRLKYYPYIGFGTLAIGLILIIIGQKINYESPQT